MKRMAVLFLLVTIHGSLLTMIGCSCGDVAYADDGSLKRIEAGLNTHNTALSAIQRDISTLREDVATLKEGQRQLENRLDDFREDTRFWLQMQASMLAVILAGLVGLWLSVWRRLSFLEAKAGIQPNKLIETAAKVLLLGFLVAAIGFSLTSCSGGGKDKPIEERDGFLYQRGGRYEAVEKYIVNPSDGYLYATKEGTAADSDAVPVGPSSEISSPATASTPTSPPAADASSLPPSDSTPAVISAPPTADVSLGVAEGGLLYSKAGLPNPMIKLRAINTDPTSSVTQVRAEVPSGSGYRLALQTYPPAGWSASVDRPFIGNDSITFSAQSGGLAPGQSLEFDVVVDDAGAPAADPSKLVALRNAAITLFDLGARARNGAGGEKSYSFPIHK